MLLVGLNCINFSPDDSFLNVIDTLGCDKAMAIKACLTSSSSNVTFTAFCLEKKSILFVDYFKIQLASKVITSVDLQYCI